MKKFIISIVAVLYITISSGIVFNVHYCMGKINSVKVDLLVKNICSCGSKKETKGCCKTEHKFIKIEDNHQASFADVVFQSPVQNIPIIYNLINTPLMQINEINTFNNHSPPLLSKQYSYIRNCVFLI